MQDNYADKILTSMIQFIERHGNEECERIEKQGQDEFTAVRNKYLAEEKKKIEENFANELANQTVRIKIEKSKEQNAQRINRMRKVNEHVEKLKAEMKEEIREKMRNDQAAYKELLKNLLVQVSFPYMNTPSIIGPHQTHGGTNFRQMQIG